MSDNTPATPPADQPSLPTGISAEEITEFLKGALQADRIAHIFVGRLLAKVRDNKLYAKLGDANLEAYARVRLQLGKTSLYNYLRVYDWVAQNQPAWLEPGPTTFIPDLNDLLGLIWIDKELGRNDLGSAAKAGLTLLKGKAMTGSLKDAEMTAFRDRTRNTAEDGRKAFLSRMRKLRTDGAELAGMPHEVISGLDELIAILKNAMAHPVLNLEEDDTAKKAKVA